MLLLGKNSFRTFVFEQRYLLCFISIFLVYFLNSLLDIMNIDAAQLANISLEMSKSGNLLHLYERGFDYLDKPHLIFWLSALSIKVFGVSNFSYKLPAILLLIGSLYFVYRFTMQWYNKITAIVAAIILGTTQAYLLMTNDVRTDGVLTSLVIFSIWQLGAYIKEGKLKYLIFGAMGVAFAMMTKGPIAAIVIGLGIGGHLLITRDWKTLLNRRWLFFLLIVAVLLLPMCYGLYTQFDLHPEKVVYDIKGPSGIKFFFWPQSFGRITGASSWDNDAGYFFFCGSILWDFQPWLLFFIPALASLILKIIKSKFTTHSNEEYISFFGFFLSFLCLSLSHYKLPHYIFLLFPFAAVITANYLVKLCYKNEKIIKVLGNVQFGILHLFFIMSFLALIFSFQTWWVIHPIILGLSYLLFLLVYLYTKTILDRIVISSVITFFGFGIMSSTYFYPALLKYQPSNLAGKYVVANHIPHDMFYYYNNSEKSLDFYAQHTVYEIKPIELNNCKPGTIIYTNEEGKNDLLIRQCHIHFSVLYCYPRFHITELNIDFLNEKTRKQTLSYSYLLKKIN